MKVVDKVRIIRHTYLMRTKTAKKGTLMTASDQINFSLREDGYHYTVEDLQTRISMALQDQAGDEWITFKIPSASEVTFSRDLLTEALTETKNNS